MSYSKILLVAVTIAAILFSLVSIPPVLAATGATQITRSNGVKAAAFFQGQVGQFRDIELFVDKSSAGTDIRLGYSTQIIIGGNAFLTTTANVFQTNGVASATLSPVTLNACVAVDANDNCIFVPVTIQATWTGFGVPSAGNVGLAPSCNPLHPSNAHELSFCNTVLQTGGVDRQATATGTLNGQSLGQSVGGDIGTFKLLIISLPPSTPTPTG